MTARARTRPSSPVPWDRGSRPVKVIDGDTTRGGLRGGDNYQLRVFTKPGGDPPPETRPPPRPAPLGRMAGVTTTETPVIDILDRAFWQRNPHDAWTWCRANDPVHRDERSGIWCITKHADVLSVERNADGSPQTRRIA